MSCPSPITHSMYADGELSAREATLLERHAATCAACRARIEALHHESAVLRAALRQVDDDGADSALRTAAARSRLRRARARRLADRRLQQRVLEHGRAAIPSELRVVEPIRIGRALRARRRVS